MTQTIHSTQTVTPPEGPVSSLAEHRKRSRTRMAIVLAVALLGATTAAAAISKSSRNCASVQSFLEPNSPSILKKLPGAFGPDEMLF